MAGSNIKKFSFYQTTICKATEEFLMDRLMKNNEKMDQKKFLNGKSLQNVEVIIKVKRNTITKYSM